MNRSTILASLALVASGGLLIAGPLNPPAGPVASSYKTLSEVEPRIAVNAVNTPGDISATFKITQPGSYYLTGNIQIVGKTGVLISSHGVTLDLNGFEIVDTAPFAGPTRHGVLVSSSDRNVCVRNGSMRDINGDGLHDQGAATRIEGLSLYGCHGVGLYSAGCPTVAGCTAHSCLGDGITVLGGSVEGCSSTENSGRGFVLTANAAVTRCFAGFNTMSGFDASGGTLTACSAVGNSYGFFLSGAEIIGCQAGGNNSGQVRAEAKSLVKSCNLDGVAGFSVIILGTSNHVEGNRVHGGTYGVQTSAGGGSNVVVGNSFFSPSIGNVSAAASDAVGPISAAVGTIASTNPFTNFSH